MKENLSKGGSHVRRAGDQKLRMADGSPRARAAAVLEARAGDRAVKQPRGQRHVARPATHGRSPVPRRTGGPARRGRLFEEALAVIEREYHSELTIERLARSIFASRRQLQRVFAEAGTSVSAVIHRVRMDHAAELLRESRLSIEEVGRAVGYRQASQFAKAFKRRHGATPSRWRETTTGARAPTTARGKAVLYPSSLRLHQRRRSSRPPREP